jgi:hypothetical protein
MEVYMKEKDFISWTRSKSRKKGKLKHTLIWCIYFILLVNVVESVSAIIRHKFIFDIENIFITTIISGVSGIYFGVMSWKNVEIKYANYINSKNKV